MTLSSTCFENPDYLADLKQVVWNTRISMNPTSVDSALKGYISLTLMKTLGKEKAKILSCDFLMIK